MNLHANSFHRSLIAVFVAVTGMLVSARQSDEFVGLSVYINVRSPAYAVAEPNTIIVYIDEPLEFVVSLWNNTKNSLPALRAQVFQSAQVAIRRRDGAAPVTSARFIAASVGEPESGLARGRAWTGKFRVDNGANSSLLPGIYIATATVPAGAINRSGPRFNDTLSFETTFEIREARTYEEMLDYYLHRAFWAKAAGRIDDERAALGEVLRRNATSAAALADLGQSWRVVGDCAQATRLLQRAIEIIASGADTSIRVSDVSKEDWISGLRGLMSTCR